jgi:hypothetical protein
MTKLLAAAAVVFALSAVPAFAGDAGPPYSLNTKGQCVDAKHKFAAAAKCAPAPAPQCKVGKPCGKSCIAKDKVCHIPAA